MRKKLRKPLAFLMAVLMMLSVMGVQVLAEDTGPSEGISPLSESVTEVQEESDDSTEVESTQEKNAEEEEQTEEPEETIELVEEEEQVPDSAEPQFANGQSTKQVFSENSGEKSLTHEKYVEYNEDDDTYDLNLTVSGAVGTRENKALLDVLLIVDKSGSMKKKLTDNGNGSSGEKNRRIDAVVNATKSLTDTLSGNKNLDVRYSVVSFSGPTDFDTRGRDSNASVNLNWSSSATAAYNTVNRITVDGGTNYEAGINRGITQLGSARADAQKIVIFLTDGMPTVRNGATACREYSNGVINEREITQNNSAAINAIKKMTADAFYCIGAGPWFSEADSFPVKNLDALCTSVNAKNTKRYTTSDTDELNQIFADIAAEHSTILCDHVEVTDDLSENVQVVMDGEKPQKLLMSVLDENGADVVTPGEVVTLAETEQNESATIQAVYQNGKIRMVFPENYKLEPNWTYKVTVKISATEKAYEKYQSADYNYPDTGEEGTGVTSAGKPGFYSNDSAEVTYTYNETEKTEPYAKPVIQLHTATVIITKKVEGNMRNVNQKFQFQYTVNGESQETIYLKDGESASIKVPCDATVSIEETGAGDYVTTYVYTIGNGEETAGEGKEVILENVTADARVTLTNTKNVNPPTGVNLSSPVPYVILFTVGIGSCAGILLWVYFKRKWKTGREQ